MVFRVQREQSVNQPVNQHVRMHSGFSAHICCKERRGRCVCVCVGSWSQFGMKKPDQNAEQIKLKFRQYLELEANQVTPAFF